jgi:DEAD/DEAH box helicase domain-containing protein
MEQDLKSLWPILESSDMIITWNGDHFDIPLLNKYYTGDLGKIKSLDLMKEVVNVLGRRLKLDTVAEATLGKKKSGHGLEAIEWWLSGEIDKIVKYCKDDVALTKEIYDYAIANNKLKYKDVGVIKEIPLNTSTWEQPLGSSMTYTLPF